MASLGAEKLASELRGLPGWSSSGGAITRTFQFGGFIAAIAFVNRAAEAAEAANHHPDIDIRYSKVTITLSTHDEGGVTDKDIALARALNGFAG